jgi:UDP-N-acetyl-D-mannosaminuronic acid dehydrogenase
VKISVVGLGYIGLPTAAIFASRKYQVLGVDVSQVAVDTINRGNVHIVEPDLDMLVSAAVNQGYLTASIKTEPADVFLIAVPTPLSESENGDDRPKPDTSFVKQACLDIAPVLQKGNLVILESTSPVGTTENMSRWLAETRPDLNFPHDSSKTIDINIAHCPERVLPGRIVRELVENDRIIGGVTPACGVKAKALYENFVQGECVVTSARTAEMTKLAENSFRDLNIAFANELSMICDEMSIDVWELRALANRHPRVDILSPGPGVGGHCIAVDPWFIVDSSPSSARLIRTSREVNRSKEAHIVMQVSDALQNKSDQTLVCLGLAFKPDIDDLRQSPALNIVSDIVSKQLSNRILVVEPNIDSLPDELEGKVELCTYEEAMETADVALLLVDHKQFRAQARPSKAIKLIDTRGVW